jgi:phospholipase D1/2
MTANIHAIRHPLYVSFWSNHQKLVVLDEEVAYVGGIDLCFGRYEDSTYRLTDPEGDVFPGRDYTNANICGEQNGPFLDEVLDRRRQPRM